MYILVADDQKELANILRTILEHSGYSVDTVYNGNDALAQARSGKYDGIIMDIMMPGLSGLQVLKKLRAEKNHIPIMLLTARDDAETKLEGLNSGANDYMQKPFAVAELLSRIKAMLYPDPSRP
ncbi:MAG: response regulator [Oscillospiraceae bacterium]|nr:response regulator [Oscillospiraceae bacterium]